MSLMNSNSSKENQQKDTNNKKAPSLDMLQFTCKKDQENQQK